MERYDETLMHLMMLWTIQSSEFGIIEESAAKFLGIPHQQLAEMRKNGKIEYSKIGNEIFYDLADLLSFLKNPNRNSN